MQIVLELQKLEIPTEENVFGDSCTSSHDGCCNGVANT